MVRSISGTLVVLLISIDSLSCSKPSPEEPRFYVVSAKVTTVLNARARPSQDSPVAYTLPRGTVVTAHTSTPVQGPRYLWREVVFGTRVAWVAAEYLEGPTTGAEAQKLAEKLADHSAAASIFVGNWYRVLTDGQIDIMAPVEIRQEQERYTLTIWGPTKSTFAGLKANCAGSACTFRGGGQSFSLTKTSSNEIRVLSSTTQNEVAPGPPYHPSPSIEEGTTFRRRASEK